VALLCAALVGAGVVARTAPPPSVPDALVPDDDPRRLGPPGMELPGAELTGTRPSGPAGRQDAIDRHGELQRNVHAAYVGWFDAVYRHDPGALATWAATGEVYEAGVEAMASESVRFIAPPTALSVGLRVDDVLLDHQDCVVVLMTDRVDRFLDAATPSRTVIGVFWPDGGGRLRLAGRWGAGTPESAWLAQCDHLVRDPVP